MTEGQREPSTQDSSSTSRYRDPHSTSGAKSDAGDAQVLSDIGPTDRHHHRLVAADSAEVEALKVLARAQQSTVWSKGRQSNGSARRCASSTQRPCSPLTT